MSNLFTISGPGKEQTEVAYGYGTCGAGKEQTTWVSWHTCGAYLQVIHGII
jgi:hypothetical protein